MNQEQHDAIVAEHDRLGGSVPFGVCFQVPIDTLRQLPDADAGRAFYAEWRNTDVVSVADATNLHR